ncbi:FKBP12-rapamycin complex-associated protein [Saprolegnia diclina VS20]|uniref:Serine/threonine-protein kinase TOR n=1 Tax=Saprolegnia diclina (strain VS20) TaxID=1156394 RepID=T0PYQ9_SAPDV|nr:FKBP12-rapamycin complex-associated protein [Saprolegnia diclina VS20]EQC27376.1 FKBP12-rapamycin complex-associated protein [Saprolegnia diclina VS20]|eukprot:XP_008619195.1 FKBP12-rapamycin complex-associated protein [Saprolegnia diclina VS20]
MLKHKLKDRDVDAVAAILTRLQAKEATVRETAALDLRAAVATLSRELTSETFARFLSELTPRLQSLLQSPALGDQLGGIAAVEALIPVATEAQIIRFANYLRSFFVTCESKDGLRAASLALGKLASTTEMGISGTLVAAFVDFEVKRAFEWLTNPCFNSSQSHRRLAACFVLKALAVAVPTLFHVNLSTFFVAIWPAIRDARVDVRDAATDALAACLQLISMRQTRHRVQWYCKIYDQVQEGLNTPAWDAIHGSLLVVMQLLQNTGSFMVPRFREVCDIVLCYKDSRDKLVARSVCLLLPQLAAYCPDAFVRHYLSTCVTHLMKRMTTYVSAAERGVAFLALGHLALSVGDHLVPQLPSIVELLQDGMKRNRYFCIETLMCVAHFTRACGTAFEPYLPSLVEQMMDGGLNDPLVEALADITKTVPLLLTGVQERLLNEISLVLRGIAAVSRSTLDEVSVGVAFAPSLDEKPLKARKSGRRDEVASSYPASSAALSLSLKTLSWFNFEGPFSILPFVRDSVCLYLTHHDMTVRKQAVVACAKLLLPTAVPKRGPSGRVIDEILQQLLQVGISDVDSNVRKSVVESLDARFDEWLSQETHLTLLFFLLNDETPSIREGTMCLLERVAPLNPAFILPLLRRVLVQLLTELEHAVDLRMLEDSTRLLGRLIRGSQHLIEPYLGRVLQVLLPKIQHGNAMQQNLASAVLTTIGELALAVHEPMAAYEPALLPLILDALQDHGSIQKRQVALVTLGQLTGSTGSVVQPYISYPKILEVLLDLLQHTAATPWQLRREAMKTIGILGALDPYKYKLCISSASLHEGNVEEGGVGLGSLSMTRKFKPTYTTTDDVADMGPSMDEKQQIELQLFTAAPVGTRRPEKAKKVLGKRSLVAKTLEAATVLPLDGYLDQELLDTLDVDLELELDPRAVAVSSEAYFPTVAIHALLNILKEPSLSMHHYGVIQAIMFIFKSLSLQCVPFLPYIVPPFLHVLARGEPRLRDSLFLQLTVLTSIVQAHLGSFFPAIIVLALRHWRAHLPQIVRLVEKIAVAVPSDFRTVYFPQLLPKILEVLQPHPHSDLLFFSEAADGGGTAATGAPSSTSDGTSTGVTSVPSTLPSGSDVDSLTLDKKDGTKHLSCAHFGCEMVVEIHIPIRVLASIQMQMVHLLVVCGASVDEAVYLLLPALTRLLEHSDTALEVKTSIVTLLAQLTQLGDYEHYAGPRLLLPLQRAIRKFGDAVLYCLCAVAFQLQDGLVQYTPLVKAIGRVLETQLELNIAHLESLVAKLVANDRIVRDDLAHASLLTPELQAWLDVSRDSRAPVVVPAATSSSSVPRLHVNQQNLRRAWEASQRSTKDDWLEWMRRFSIELLRESPSAALRSCCSLAQAYNPLARALFNSAFVSCWNDLHEQYQDYLVRALETAFQSDTISAEILQTLLNLAEFMEHDVEALPIDIRELGELAQKCHAYAKALHYKELEFHTSPSTCIEALISINNQVGQPEAAVGILKYAQLHHRSVIQVKESWYEKLQNWQGALDLYDAKLAEPTTSGALDLEAATGKMRCLEALGEWEELAALAKHVWASLRPSTDAPTARACWWLSEWDTMEQYVQGVQTNPTLLAPTLPGTDPELGAVASLYKSVLAVHHNQFEDAQSWIDATRKSLDTTLGALVGESYIRAYRTVVTLQQLSELEEIIAYKKLRLQVGKADEAAKYKRRMVKMWQTRLTGCKRVVDVWQQLLAVRSLVLAPHEDIETWLQFASLCRQSGNLALSLKVFTHALAMGFSNLGYSEKDHHRVAFAYLKHLWAVGDKQKALSELGTLVQTLSRRSPLTGIGAVATNQDEEIVKCHLKWAEWQLAIHEQQLDRVPIAAVLGALKTSTELEPSSYKAWHAWALMNFHVAEYHSQLPPGSNQVGGKKEDLGPYIASAIEGFFRSIALGRSRWAANVQQDILRVLTLWFAYGHRSDVHGALVSGFQSVSIETWLIVIPQLIARIHSPHPRIQSQLHRLLSAIGTQHPHALIYPLSVALKSPLEVRQRAAEAIMNSMRKNYVDLVNEALLVSRELIRVAILWHELWHEGLEEASRLYFGEHDVEGMMAVLEPLHAMMEKGPETLREVSFHQAFGRDLKEAYDWIQRYLSPHGAKNESDLNQAWDRYYHVFRRINKQLPQLTTLELQYVSPNLLHAHELQLAVPGTYRAGHAIVKIRSFVPTMLVLTSKQRPRRITIVGTNGLEYMFLLKGHEDLRQDERVTQLFGLVNALLINDRTTSKKDLKITRYPVIPLSHNAGIVGWVPNCDTLHQLIRDYREARKILLNIEHRLMLQMAPDYDVLCLLQKVEVFQYALENTAGQDLYKVLWLKSENSEVWLDRRTNYTRSLAAMSMVGYILGLGDRHPSNLMLHRFTGTIVHIDFGDCFEVAMQREKYPEKIPFRLTRMLTNAMEVSGIEGNFRFSCESVMQVLRDNRHSLMAMLEAFVHDPLICWRLLAPNVSPATKEKLAEFEPPKSVKKPAPVVAPPVLPPVPTPEPVVLAPPPVVLAPVPEATIPAVVEPPPAPMTTTNSMATPAMTAVDADVPPRPPQHPAVVSQSLSKSIAFKRNVMPNVESHQLHQPERRPSFSGRPPMHESGNNPNLHLEISSLAASVGFSLSRSLRVNEHVPLDDQATAKAAPVSASQADHELRNRSHREKELVHALGPEGAGAPREALNEKAVAVIRRVQAKLTGRDFDDCREPLSVSDQVQRLITQAASHENLCQCYIGWCPFW